MKQENGWNQNKGVDNAARFNTRLLHGKTSAGYGQREILPPISQVTAFQYESMEELEKVFGHKSMGYAYTRIGNPTLAAFEQKLSELEGGVGAVCWLSVKAEMRSSPAAVCTAGPSISCMIWRSLGSIPGLRRK